MRGQRGVFSLAGQAKSKDLVFAVPREEAHGIEYLVARRRHLAATNHSSTESIAERKPGAQDASNRVEQKQL